jgi:drug/metabolite transporter (DMT)-like permease
MQRDLRAEGLLVLTALIWGGTFAAIKWALIDISPMLLVGIRFLLAAFLAWPLLLRREVSADQTDSIADAQKPHSLFSRTTWLWGALIGLGMLAGYAGQTIGLKYTTVARSGFITYSFALYVPFLQFFIIGKRPGVGNLLGLFVVILGLSFITDPKVGVMRAGDFSPLRVWRVAAELSRGGWNKGDLFTFGGAVGYAFYVVLLDRATRICHPGEVTLVQMFVCGILALVLSPLVETPVLVLSWRLAGALLYLVMLGSIVALALMNWFQRRLSPLRAVLIYSLEPVFAAFIGWTMFGTGMSVREIIGAFFILSGILVSDLWDFIRRSHRT